MAVGHEFPLTNFSFSFDAYDISQVSGYNQKLYVIIDAFTKCLKTLADDVTEEQYRVFVQQLAKSYENVFRKPKSIGKELRLSVVQAHHVPLTEKNRRLKKIALNDFQAFCRQYGEQVKIKAVMQGNMLEERALSMMQIVLSNLNCGKINDVSTWKRVSSEIPNLICSLLRIHSHHWSNCVHRKFRPAPVISASNHSIRTMRTP